MLITLLSVVAGVLVYRFFTRGERGAGQSAIDDVAGFDDHDSTSRIRYPCAPTTKEA